MFYIKCFGIAFVLFCLMGAYNYVKRHGMTTLIFRFLLGHLMNGSNPTGSKHFSRGVSTDRIGKWPHLSHMHRAGYRLLGVGIVASGIWSWFYDRIILALVMATVATVFIMTAASPRKMRNHVTNRQTVRPLAQALAPYLGTTPAVANAGLWINKGYKKADGGETVATITMLDEFGAMPQQQAMINTLMASRLGVGITPTWQTDIRPMKVTYRAAYKPPDMVPWLSMLPEIRKCKENEVLIGITGKNDRKVWDMKAEEPHALVAANTRRGKTRLAMLITCQVLHKGGGAILIDPKRVGLDEFVAGHPKAKVFSNPREVESNLWQPILDFKDILNDRIDEFEADRTVTFDRQLLVIDELSMWASISKQHWDKARTGKDKATPPIFFDLCECLWAGAQFNMNVLVFGQMIGHSVLGNAVESFGFRMLGGFTRQSYSRLVGIPPIPASQKGRGRFLIHDGDDYPQWTQAILGEIDEMRDYAMEPYRAIAGVPVKEITVKGLLLRPDGATMDIPNRKDHQS